MESDKKYHLVAQKIKGDVIPIEWTKIPCFNGGLNGHRLKTIDQFTSKFENEKELKDFIKQWGLEIGLNIKKKKITEDSFCQFISSFLFKKLEANPQSYDVRRTLLSMGDAIGSSIELQIALQKASKSGVDRNNKSKIYQAMIKKELLGLINNDLFPPYLKETIYNYIAQIEFDKEQAEELSCKVEKIELNYTFETFPLKIIFYNGRRQFELYNGIAYQKDAKFLDREYIYQYLTSKTIENDFDLLNRLIKLYEKIPSQVNSINGIREYMAKIKAKQEGFIPIPKWAIDRIIEHEVEQYDETEKTTKLGRDGKPLIDYYRLRKLGMFLSSYESEKEHLYQMAGISKKPARQFTLEKRLEEIPREQYVQTDMFSFPGKIE